MAEHIRLSDPVTPEGLRHLFHCEDCQKIAQTVYLSFCRSAILDALGDGPDA